MMSTREIRLPNIREIKYAPKISKNELFISLMLF